MNFAKYDRSEDLSVRLLDQQAEPEFEGKSIPEGATQRVPSSPPEPFDSPPTAKLKPKIIRMFFKYLKFLGPGIMVSVANMDPGNYSTAVSAGAKFEYKLLVTVFVSNIMAIFLQSLCTKLGCVTGLDLAQNCRAHLPKKLNLLMYIMAELAIIATDLAEVVGTAVSLNILFGVPLFWGVVLTVIDVLVVLMAYRPNGPLLIIRVFEGFVGLLVLATVICFTVELVGISDTTDWREVFVGYLPSKTVFKGEGLYLSLAILGATCMPHSLFLGSGLVQPRLRDFDEKHGYLPKKSLEEIGSSRNVVERFFANEEEEAHSPYKPSLEAINDSMTYAVTELVVSLLTVALFVNSAILIVAGSTLTDKEITSDDAADLFTIYELLSEHLTKTAGLVFALALLFSGQSAGITCTLAGQMVCEGFLRWNMHPAARRLIVRGIAIAPCLLLVLVSGREGLSSALNMSQVVLSFLLPPLAAPLIWFTCNKNIMKVPIFDRNAPEESIELQNLSSSEGLNQNPELSGSTDHIAYKDMSNGVLTSATAVSIWVVISFLNLFLLANLLWGSGTI
ncbi:hypothetical protein LJB42_002162 [Komagataella kurtzmanii]|nr:hypothetical protein LJB42_002162 [Komagataella kurtzmanii]